MLLACSNYSREVQGSSTKASKDRDLSTKASQSRGLQDQNVVLHKKSSLPYKLGSV